MLSDYHPDSELSRLSRRAPTEQPVALSKDLAQLLFQGQQVAAASGGAFDMTVGPLTRLWRRARRRQRLPSAQRLTAARQAVGYQHLVVDRAQRTAMLKRPGMRLDLGGIAKGYAVDQALQTITSRGIQRALVNASGDMAAAAPPPGQAGWKVAVAPLQPDAPPSRFGRLAHQAIATSGDAFQYVEIDGTRYSHIVDPRTGLGLTVRSSASVLADCCTTADALASAASVLGPKEALKLMGQYPEAELLLVTQSKQEVSVCQTPGFKAWLAEAPENNEDIKSTKQAVQ
jgi:thiamine biosynthesis lipoprotein